MRLFWPVVAILLAACGASTDDPSAAQLERRYWGELDDWVKGGGTNSEVQTRVVENCGKLVMITVGGSERAALSTTRREDFHFRVDVCVKTTVHRVHPQPEFSDPVVIRTICRDSDVALFRDLCVKANLRPTPNAT